MIINNRNTVENIRLGRTVKSTIVSSLNTVEETVGTIQDTVITARSAVELMHGALQEPIMEQRIDLAKAIQAGLKELVENGMPEIEAYRLLQVDYVLPRKTPISREITK